MEFPHVDTDDIPRQLTADDDSDRSPAVSHLCVFQPHDGMLVWLHSDPGRKESELIEVTREDSRLVENAHRGCFCCSLVFPCHAAEPDELSSSRNDHRLDLRRLVLALSVFLNQTVQHGDLGLRSRGDASSPTKKITSDK